MKTKQESRAVARKLCDAAAVLSGLKFADNILYKFKSSQVILNSTNGSHDVGSTKDLQFFFADSKYSADRSLLPHIRTSPLVTYANRLYNKYATLLPKARFVIVKI